MLTLFSTKLPVSVVCTGDPLVSNQIKNVHGGKICCGDDLIVGEIWLAICVYNYIEVVISEKGILLGLFLVFNQKSDLKFNKGKSGQNK